MVVGVFTVVVVVVVVVVVYSWSIQVYRVEYWYLAVEYKSILAHISL